MSEEGADDSDREAGHSDGNGEAPNVEGDASGVESEASGVEWEYPDREGVLTATFLVSEADEDTAVLRDVRTNQIHALSENPDLHVGEILEGTIAPEPPLELAWEVLEIETCRAIPVERSPERPTKQARDIAADQDVGDVARRERAGKGKLHVLTVPEEETESAAQDVVDDEETVVRAAEFGVERVEVRAADGVLCVRYLP
ncbi:MAG: DUF5812 family protein [Haloarculaceae archaeon]